MARRTRSISNSSLPVGRPFLSENVGRQQNSQSAGGSSCLSESVGAKRWSAPSRNNSSQATGPWLNQGRRRGLSTSKHTGHRRSGTSSDSELPCNVPNSRSKEPKWDTRIPPQAREGLLYPAKPSHAQQAVPNPNPNHPTIANDGRLNTGVSGNGWKREEVKALTLDYQDQIDNHTEVIADAGVLVDRLSELERHILMQMWSVILERISKTRSELKDSKLPAKEAVVKLQSLLKFIQGFKERFVEFERKGVTFADKK